MSSSYLENIYSIGTETKNLPSLMNIMMELRKCCNHPFLIRGVEATVIEDSCRLCYRRIINR